MDYSDPETTLGIILPRVVGYFKLNIKALRRLLFSQRIAASNSAIWRTSIVSVSNRWLNVEHFGRTGGNCAAAGEVNLVPVKLLKHVSCSEQICQLVH